MPIIKSQVKSMRKSREHAERNRAIKSEVKTYLRQFSEAYKAGDKETATINFQNATRALDKAASKGVLHKNNVANKKSRMAHQLNSL